MNMPEVLFQGSVKTVRGKPGDSPYVFEFTDNYSVFDWGKMPDTLLNKGEALSFISNLFFDLLGDKNQWQRWDCPASMRSGDTYYRIMENGMKHHFLSKVDQRMNRVTCDIPSRYLSVKPVKILRPVATTEQNELRWNYEGYQNKPVNTLIPLEVVFRFDVPPGSSLLERAQDSQYLKEIGLNNRPKEGDSFEMPIIEFSSKLETSDRYMTYAEAKKISFLSENEFKELHETTMLLALRLRSLFNECSIKLSDGKFEFAWDENRRPMLVDVITPDELRISYRGKSLSKENIREVYRATKWHQDIKTAKKLASERGEKDWKKLCTTELKSQPPKLEENDLERFSMIYIGLANTLFEKLKGKTIFSNAWSLDELIKRL
jgi:phosphoribosylaminoimidazole-succinocarboxamide synthase